MINCKENANMFKNLEPKFRLLCIFLLLQYSYKFNFAISSLFSGKIFPPKLKRKYFGFFGFVLFFLVCLFFSAAS